MQFAAYIVLQIVATVFPRPSGFPVVRIQTNTDWPDAAELIVSESIVWLNPSECVVWGTQVLHCLISFGFRKRSLVVSVAGCLLIFGAARDEPLHAFPGILALMTVPSAAHLYSNVSWPPNFPSKSMTGPSRLPMTTFAAATERLPDARARANASSPSVLLQPVSSTNFAGVRSVANTSVWGQSRWQVHVDGGTSLNGAINLAQPVAAAGKAVCSSSLYHLNSSRQEPATSPTRRSIASISFAVCQIAMARAFSQAAMTATTARVAEAAQLREVHQLQLCDAVFGDSRHLKRLQGTSSS
jgi:hypothetical protein